MNDNREPFVIMNADDHCEDYEYFKACFDEKKTDKHSEYVNRGIDLPPVKVISHKWSLVQKGTVFATEVEAKKFAKTFVVTSKNPPELSWAVRDIRDSENYFARLYDGKAFIAFLFCEEVDKDPRKSHSALNQSFVRTHYLSTHSIKKVSWSSIHNYDADTMIHPLVDPKNFHAIAAHSRSVNVVSKTPKTSREKKPSGKKVERSIDDEVSERLKRVLLETRKRDVDSKNADSFYEHARDVGDAILSLAWFSDRRPDTNVEGEYRGWIPLPALSSVHIEYDEKRMRVAPTDDVVPTYEQAISVIRATFEGDEAVQNIASTPPPPRKKKDNKIGHERKPTNDAVAVEKSTVRTAAKTNEDLQSSLPLLGAETCQTPVVESAKTVCDDIEMNEIDTRSDHPKPLVKIDDDAMNLLRVLADKIDDISNRVRSVEDNVVTINLETIADVVESKLKNCRFGYIGNTPANP